MNIVESEEEEMLQRKMIQFEEKVFGPLGRILSTTLKAEDPQEYTAGSEVIRAFLKKEKIDNETAGFFAEKIEQAGPSSGSHAFYYRYIRLAYAVGVFELERPEGTLEALEVNNIKKIMQKVNRTELFNIKEFNKISLKDKIRIILKWEQSIKMPFSVIAALVNCDIAEIEKLENIPSIKVVDLNMDHFIHEDFNEYIIDRKSKVIIQALQFRPDAGAPLSFVGEGEVFTPNFPANENYSLNFSEKSFSLKFPEKESGKGRILLS
jgi:hypothetical protein